MKILHDGIFEIPNFASEYECSRIVSIANNIPERMWNIGEGEWEGRIMPLCNVPELFEIRQNISKRVPLIFKSFLNIKNSGTIISRVKSNTGGLGLHRDNYTDTLVKYGLVLYFNDDFSDGEIVYPYANVVYKPSAGSLIIHEARHEHKVNPVTAGTRYMATYFVEGDENTPAIMKEDV